MNKIGTNLERFILIEERNYPSASGSLSLCLSAISSAAKLIASQVRRAGLLNILGKHGSVNPQNEEVQKLDLIANDIMITHLSASGQFFALASEEMEDAVFPEEGKNGKYIISFDPLDGSSNIDVNVNIGTIFSIHRKKEGTTEDFYQKGSDQIASGYIIYGPSTIFVYTTGTGVNAFTLDPLVGMFLLSHPNIKIPKDVGIYSVNEGNYNLWDDTFKYTIDQHKKNNHKARYIGSMVADVHRTLITGGHFYYPADTNNSNGKLRLLYEASPMAFIFQQANGDESDGHQSILDIEPTRLHQRTPVILGGKKN
jgi:fructose-1,6-bisphosphatase I